MGTLKLGAIILIVLGTLGLVYGQFSLLGGTHSAVVGPVGMTMHGWRNVNVPLWVSIAAIVTGSLLLFTRSPRHQS